MLPPGRPEYRQTAESANVRPAMFASIAVTTTVLVVGVVVALVHDDRQSEPSVAGSRATATTRSAQPARPRIPSARPLPMDPLPTQRIPEQAENQLRWVFQSPSGNIGCVMDGLVKPATVSCVIREHTYTVPGALGPGCTPGDSHRFDMAEGQPPSIACIASVDGFGLPVQDYGKPVSAGSITCVSEIDTGVTCNDSRTGHFFQVARQAYTAG